MNPFAFVQMGVGGFFGMAEHYSEAQAAKLAAEGTRLKGQQKKRNLEFNAELMDLAAADSIERGEQEAHKAGMKGRKVRGYQRAATGASGIEIGAGSAGQLEQETEFLAEMDMIQIRSNAFRESWGYKLSASESRYQAKAAEIAAESEAVDLDQKGNVTVLSMGMAKLKGSMAASGGMNFGGR